MVRRTLCDENWRRSLWAGSGLPIHATATSRITTGCGGRRCAPPLNRSVRRSLRSKLSERRRTVERGNLVTASKSARDDGRL